MGGAASRLTQISSKDGASQQIDLPTLAHSAVQALGQLLTQRDPSPCDGAGCRSNFKFELCEWPKLSDERQAGLQGIIRQGRALDSQGVHRSNEQSGFWFGAVFHPQGSSGLCGEFHEQRSWRDGVAREVVFKKPQLRIQMPYPDAVAFDAFEGI